VTQLCLTTILPKVSHTHNGDVTIPRLFLCIILLGSDLYYFLFNIKLAFISFLFVSASGTTPRFRYDKLTCFAWRRFLHLSL